MVGGIGVDEARPNAYPRGLERLRAGESLTAGPGGGGLYLWGSWGYMSQNFILPGPVEPMSSEASEATSLFGTGSFVPKGEKKRPVQGSRYQTLRFGCSCRGAYCP